VCAVQDPSPPARMDRLTRHVGIKHERPVRKLDPGESKYSPIVSSPLSKGMALPGVRREEIMARTPAGTIAKRVSIAIRVPPAGYV